MVLSPLVCGRVEQSWWKYRGLAALYGRLLRLGARRCSWGSAGGAILAVLVVLYECQGR